MSSILVHSVTSPYFPDTTYRFSGDFSFIKEYDKCGIIHFLLKIDPKNTFWVTNTWGLKRSEDE
jgi:hypothetical protein